MTSNRESPKQPRRVNSLDDTKEHLKWGSEPVYRPRTLMKRLSSMTQVSWLGSTAAAGYLGISAVALYRWLLERPASSVVTAHPPSPPRHGFLARSSPSLVPLRSSRAHHLDMNHIKIDFLAFLWGSIFIKLPFYWCLLVGGKDGMGAVRYKLVAIHTTTSNSNNNTMRGRGRV